MVITMLDGSPKMKKSNSSLHLDQMETLLSDHKIERFMVNKGLLQDEELNKIVKSDILIISFSLYIDGLCTKLLENLYALEQKFQSDSDQHTMVYAIANNGFYEGDQNEWALKMIQCFCKRAGITFGQGIGIGAGEFVGGFLAGGMPAGKMFLKNYGKLIQTLKSNIENKTSGELQYCSPNCSSFFFKLTAERGFWDSEARKNGIKRSQLH